MSDKNLKFVGPVGIYVDRINVTLLRQQRNNLLAILNGKKPNMNLVDGLVNLLDYMLDTAEGYETN